MFIYNATLVRGLNGKIYKNQIIVTRNEVTEKTTFDDGKDSPEGYFVLLHGKRQGFIKVEDIENGVPHGMNKLVYGYTPMEALTTATKVWDLEGWN